MSQLGFSSGRVIFLEPTGRVGSVGRARLSLRVLGPGYRVEPSDWVVGLGFDEIRIALDNFSVKREPFRNNFRISFTLFELTSSADGAVAMILSQLLSFLKVL